MHSWHIFLYDYQPCALFLRAVEYWKAYGLDLTGRLLEICSDQLVAYMLRVELRLTCFACRCHFLGIFLFIGNTYAPW